MLTYFHAEQLLHHPRTYLSRGRMRSPQEVPERALRLLAASKSLGFDVREPSDSGSPPIAAIHNRQYLRFLEEAHREWKKMPEDWGDEVISNIYVREPNARRGVLAQAAYYQADGSCPIGPHTWRSAYWSAQSALAAVAAINSGAGREAYALCRPPGHHARADAAGGFCYLNNAAIAAQALLRVHRRVAILDVDMHHGQGVQQIFYGRGDVLYVSIHGDPTNFYPAVAGYEGEHGTGERCSATQASPKDCEAGVSIHGADSMRRVSGMLIWVMTRGGILLPPAWMRVSRTARLICSAA